MVAMKNWLKQLIARIIAWLPPRGSPANLPNKSEPQDAPDLPVIEHGKELKYYYKEGSPKQNERATINADGRWIELEDCAKVAEAGAREWYLRETGVGIPYSDYHGSVIKVLSGMQRRSGEDKSKLIWVPQIMDWSLYWKSGMVVKYRYVADRDCIEPGVYTVTFNGRTVTVAGEVNHRKGGAKINGKIYSMRFI
jgi:hypothetical protein